MKDGVVMKLFGQAGIGIKRFLTSKIPSRVGGWALRLIVSFGLSRSVVFGGYAPFGLAAVAASGGGIGGLFGLMGALLGYFTAPNGVDGLRYAAASVLIFATAFIFRDTTLYKRSFFMPLVATITCAAIGFVFVADSGYMPDDIALYICEVVLVAGTAYFYHMAIGGRLNYKDAGAPKETKRLVSWLVVLATLLIPVSSINLFGIMSIGRVSAVVLIMLCAFYGGAAGGSISGISAGLAMDIVGGYPLFTMIYGFSGLTAGMFAGAGKLWSAVSFVLSGALSVLWLSGETVRMPVMIENFIASVIFMLLPESVGPRIRLLFSSGIGETPVQAEMVREQAKEKLKKIATAFKELYENLQTGQKVNSDGELSVVFDRTAERICRRCGMAGVCWGKESYETYNALNDASRVMLSRGRVEIKDFPPYFASRCISLGKFQTTVNEELSALLYRRQYKSRLAESRKVAGMQYHEIAGVITEIAAELDVEMNFNPEAEQRIGRFLKQRNIDAEVSAYKKGNGRAAVEIAGPDLSRALRESESVRAAVSGALGVLVDKPEQIRSAAGERLVYGEAEPYGAVIGVAAQKMDGQKVSGDSGAYFKTEDGKLYIILSDGMGTGKEAANESGMVVRMLERFLRAGLAPAAALRILNSSLLLRDDEESAFATADLLSVDLFTGELSLHKCGAAPSYVRRGDKLSRVTGKTIPAGLGIQEELPADTIRMKVAEGDYVVLTSDGVSEEEGESWLADTIKVFVGKGPKELAVRIMERAGDAGKKKDDMTVLVLQVEKRRTRRET